MNSQHTRDSVGQLFDRKIFLEAREICQKIIKEFAVTIPKGTKADAIKSELEKVFHNAGLKKFWHPTKIRIAQDTMKTFRAENDKSLETCDGELYFIDCGPVYENHEADYGETFRLNSDEICPLMKACQEVFNFTATQWREQKLTGVDLYLSASKYSKKLGFELNPLMAGHRIGDFPHQLYGQGKMAEMDYSPTSELWVLEIHLIDQRTQRGAFFEDILL